MIQARIDAGLAKAAAVLGTAYQQFRPLDALQPLAVPIATLQGGVVRDPGLRFAGTPAFGEARRFWLGSIQTLRVGDVLVGDGGTLFVASVAACTPPMLIDCNAVVDLYRWMAGSGYGGGTEAVVAHGWPASVRLAGRGAAPLSDLPGDAHGGGWQVLMPVLPGVTVQQGMRLVDAAGRRFLVAAVENSALGLHILASQSGG